MDEDRRDALRDLVALFTGFVFTVPPGLGLFLVVFYTAGPLILGPLDQPLGSPFMVVGIFGLFGILLFIGGFIGSMFWIVVMSRFLPKQTMYKWITYGPQIRPLLKLYLRLLDSLYAK